ncbi:MAG: carbon storage regulator [Pirellula sp.]
MLILGRRANQSIVFPNCGITVRILDVNGRVAKIGIEAPRRIEIMRGELAAVALSQDSHTQIGNAEYSIEPDDSLENEQTLLQCSQRLAEIKNGLHTFQQLRAAGDESKADSVLAELLSDIANLDKDWLEAKWDIETGRDCEAIKHNSVSEPSTTYRCAPNSPETKHVLIVNDATDRNSLLVPTSSFQGFQTCTVNNVLLAKNTFSAREPFDVVVCNCGQESGANEGLVRSLRSLTAYDQTTILVVDDTANMLEKIHSANRLGIDGWLASPLAPNDLWNHLIESYRIER